MMSKKVPYPLLIAFILFTVGAVWGVQRATKANTPPTVTVEPRNNEAVVIVPGPTNFPPTITPILIVAEATPQTDTGPEILTDREAIFAQIAEIEKQVPKQFGREGWYYQSYREKNTSPLVMLPGTDSAITTNEQVQSSWMYLDEQGNILKSVTLLADAQGNSLQPTMSINDKGINFAVYGNSELQKTIDSVPSEEDIEAMSTYSPVFWGNLSSMPLLKSLPSNATIQAWWEGKQLIVRTTQTVYELGEESYQHHTISISSLTGMPDIEEFSIETSKGEEVTISQAIFEVPYKFIEKLPPEAEAIFLKGQTIIESETNGVNHEK